MFRNMANDIITIIKSNGDRFENLKASVQGNKIYYFESQPLIETGDEIIRVASNGSRDHMIVVDPGFKEAFHRIPAHYQMTVRTSSTPMSQPANIVYNIHGNNARVNHGSVDRSINVVQHDQSSEALIKELRDSINQAQLSKEQHEECMDALDVVATQFESGNPKASIISRMLDVLPNIANAGEAIAKLINLAQGTSS